MLRRTAVAGLAALRATAQVWLRRIVPYRIYRPRGTVLPPGTAEFVLVPGGGHPGSCFHKVTTRLEVSGQTVHTHTLPGVGDRAGELTAETGLETHIADVVRRLEEQDLRDVVLVGHSYAGMVITGAADRVPDRIRHLVYLDAAQPRNGQSLVEAQPFALRVPAVANRVERGGVEVTLVPNDGTIAFLGLHSPEDIAWARRSLTPHPWKCFTDPLDLDDPEIARTIGSSEIYTYRSARGKTRAGLMDADTRARAWVVHAVHDLMLTEPDLVCDMLLTAAARSR